MDPFTQRMLERARARREKIDSKLADNGQDVTPRKPLAENKIPPSSSDKHPSKTVKSPERKSDVISPQRSKKSAKSPPRRPSKDSESPRRPSCLKSPSRRVSADGRTDAVANVCRSPARKSSRDERTKSYVVESPRQSDLREVCVTTTEYLGSSEERTSDVSVEINIVHRDDVQIQVQVEERDAPLTVRRLPAAGNTGDSSDKENLAAARDARSGLRQDSKARLDRLGVLYSDKTELSSPIHRTESEFTSATPPWAAPHVAPSERSAGGKRKLARLAALADTINNWEDDTTHHDYKPEVTTKTEGKARGGGKMESQGQAADESTLDVSIHSLRDIERAVRATKATDKSPSKACSRLTGKTVAALEAAGYRRDSAGQSRLVYDFSTSGADRHRQESRAAPRDANMATAVAVPTHGVVKKPSIKKYKAPTPPRQTQRAEANGRETDSQNNLVNKEENDNDVAPSSKQTNEERPIEVEEKAPSNRSSPIVKRAPNLNGGERNSVMSKAAMFENGSPFARDPTTMSIRERKALFEKNKGVAIVPKAPFGQAPSAKQLQGDTKADASKPTKPVLTSTLSNSTDKSTASAASVVSTSANSTKSTDSTTVDSSKSLNSSKSAGSAEASASNSREELAGGGGGGQGIRGKLAALFSKEQTISESSIADRVRRERQQELAMLQNRFNYKPKAQRRADSDSDSEPDATDSAPLMGSAASLALAAPPAAGRAAAAPASARLSDKCRSETALHRSAADEADVAVAQPAKRRSSQDSPAVLAVLDDVKRIRVHSGVGKQAASAQPAPLYPRLADIDTAPSDDTDCGGSSVEDVRTERPKIRFNTSENWAETSFGRDIMQAVKQNNCGRAEAADTSTASGSSLDSDLDGVLDEALDDVTDEGPTPPKLNKNGNTLSSVSFTYKQGSPVKLTAEFKSPLKQAALAAPAGTRRDELVHSVSFYRRMQSASSQPSTPVRAVRHTAERDDSAAPAEAERERVTTVRQRIGELQAEIGKQQTVISQASQALNLCAATVEFSGSTEQAEGERLLLLATHRRQACLHEIQRLQVEGPGPAAERGAVALSLSSLSVPLRRDYIRQLNADGAVGHHCVCLLKCRDRVIATSMQLTKPSSNVLHFPDHVQMEGLASDFKVTVEVYLLQASKELLPHEVKYHITNKKSSKLLTPKSKVSELKAPRVCSPAGPGAVRTPQLQPHGYCIFALPQAKRTSFTLNKVPHASPLEGAVGVQISARMTLPPPEPHAAFLTAFDDVSGLGAWHRRWCALQPPRLSWWRYPDDVRKKMPMGDLDLATVVSDKVIRAPRDLCARPNTLLLESAVPAGAVAPDGGSLVYRTRDDGTIVRRHLLAADTQEERDAWLDVLNRALEYVRCTQQD